MQPSGMGIALATLLLLCRRYFYCEGAQRLPLAGSSKWEVCVRGLAAANHAVSSSLRMHLG